MLLLETAAKLRFQICSHNYKTELRAGLKQPEDSRQKKLCKGEQLHGSPPGCISPAESKQCGAQSAKLRPPRFLQGLNFPRSRTRSSFCHATPPRSVSCSSARSFPLSTFFQCGGSVWVPASPYRGLYSKHCADVGLMQH